MKTYRTAPWSIDQAPPGIPFIIGNEGAERFSFYGMRAILVVFMTQYLMGATGELDLMNEEQAKGWFHLFVSGVYFLPLFGALISDGLWVSIGPLLFYLSSTVWVIWCWPSTTRE